VEILTYFTLKKWKIPSEKAWKSGIFRAKSLGKMEIIEEICLEKWKL